MYINATAISHNKTSVNGVKYSVSYSVRKVTFGPMNSNVYCRVCVFRN